MRVQRFSPRTEEAEPNWKQFATDHEAAIGALTGQAFASARAVLLGNPPKREEYDGTQVEWRPNPRRANETDAAYLFRVVSREPECTAVRAAKAGPKHVTEPWVRRVVSAPTGLVKGGRCDLRGARSMVPEGGWQRILSRAATSMSWMA